MPSSRQSGPGRAGIMPARRRADPRETRAGDTPASRGRSERMPPVLAECRTRRHGRGDQPQGLPWAPALYLNVPINKLNSLNSGPCPGPLPWDPALYLGLLPTSSPPSPPLKQAARDDAEHLNMKR